MSDTYTLPMAKKMCSCINCPGKKEDAAGVAGVCLVKRDDSGQAVCKCGGCDGVCAGTAGTDWCEDCWDPESEWCMYCPCCGDLHLPNGKSVDRDEYLGYNSDVELEMELCQKKDKKNAERRADKLAKDKKREEKNRAAKKARVEKRDASNSIKVAAGGSAGSGGLGGSGGPAGLGGSGGPAGLGGSGGPAGLGGSGGSNKAISDKSGATGDANGTDTVDTLLSLQGTTRENPVIV